VPRHTARSAPWSVTTTTLPPPATPSGVSSSSVVHAPTRKLIETHAVGAADREPAQGGGAALGRSERVREEGGEARQGARDLLGALERDPADGSADGGAQPLVVEGLEDVVHRVQLEGLHRMPVERGHEHHRWHPLWAELRDDV
jgi:hypothetical protein